MLMKLTLCATFFKDEKQEKKCVIGHKQVWEYFIIRKDKKNYKNVHFFLPLQ